MQSELQAVRHFHADHQSSEPTSTLTEKKIFAKSVGGGGTGVYVADGATTNEFVSKSKSIIYGLIF